MTKEETVEVLCEVARRAALESSADHPVDVALAMSMAIETAGATMTVIRERERKKDA